MICSSWFLRNITSFQTSGLQVGHTDFHRIMSNTLTFSSSTHQIPVHTPTTGTQVFSRKEFNDHSCEVLLTHDVVKWTFTTVPLTRLPTKHHILQFVSQDSAHVLPSLNQKSPYQDFWHPEVHVHRLRNRLDAMLILKVWFVTTVS